MLTTSVIENILERLPALTIGVIGDLFLDRYLDLDASLTEPSLETGLPAYQVTRVRSCPGAAGTVINNLDALGVGCIMPVAIVGDDGEGHELRQALEGLRVVDQQHLAITRERRTPTYTKPMLCENGQLPRELNRLDIKNRTPMPAELESRVLSGLDVMWREADAIVVSEIKAANLYRSTSQAFAVLLPVRILSAVAGIVLLPAVARLTARWDPPKALTKIA